MRVLITGAFRYPDGDAAAFRVASVAELFERAGASVVIAGWEAATRGASYHHEGTLCVPQAEFREGEAGLLRRFTQFVTRGSRTMLWLRTQPAFDVIVAYNPPALFALRLLRHCSERGAVAVLDSTEWYESSHLPLGRFGPAALENWVRMRVVYPRFANVIAISSWLASYYRGRNVLRLPPLIPPSVPSVTEREGPPAVSEMTRKDIQRSIELAYAGQPGRKDRLSQLVRALPVMERALGRSVRLTIAGLDVPAFEQYCRREGIDPRIAAEQVRCLGRVSRAEVAQLYHSAHFSVLFRDDARYAWAGFPTKAMESWQHGCPIICNAVGELATIGRDGEDVLFVDADDLAGTLVPKLAAVGDARRFEEMSHACVRKSHDLFSADRFRAAFSSFVNALGGSTAPIRHVARSAA